MRFPFLQAAWAYMNEEGPGFLPFSRGPTQRGYLAFYRDALNEQEAQEARAAQQAAARALTDEDEYEEPEEETEEIELEPEWQVEPEPEPAPEPPPTREEMLSGMTLQHENNLAQIEMLPLDDDVREGLKNEAIDRFEAKVRNWLT